MMLQRLWFIANRRLAGDPQIDLCGFRMSIIWEHLEKSGRRLGKSGTHLDNIWVETGSTMGQISDQRIVSIGKVWEAPTFFIIMCFKSNDAHFENI